MLNATFVFGKRAPVAKFHNKKFTAKGFRNDVTLYQSATFKNEQSKGFTSIVNLLNDMEKDWVDEQKHFQQPKILENQFWRVNVYAKILGAV